MTTTDDVRPSVPAAATEADDGPVTTQRRADIQGMRGLAVILVVLYHAHLGVPGGYVGVDVFFVVSGYVITRLLVGELGRTGTLHLGAFYLRRIRRILPALATLLVVTMVLTAVVGPIDSVRRTAGTAGSASLSSANIYLWLQGLGGYFHAAATSNPLLHTWSLSLEEQFYVLFPSVILLTAIAARRWGGPDRRRPALAVAVAAVATVSFLLCWTITTSNFPAKGLDPTFAFFMAPTRAWQFGVGALLAVIGLGVRGRIAAEVAASAGLALVLYAALRFNDQTLFPGVAAAVPTLGAALLIVAGGSSVALLTRALSARPLTVIGDVSYSWYLWHWPLIVFARSLWPNSTALPVVAAAVSIVPAVASYRWVEQPLRRARTPTVRTLRLGIACVSVPLLTAGALVVVNQQLHRRPALIRFDRQTAVHIDIRRGCDLGVPVIPSPRCTFPVPGATPSTSVPGKVGNVLVGDSNAGQFSEPFIAASHAQGRAATTINRSVCPFGDLRLYRNQVPDRACRNFVTQMVDELVRVKPDLVVIAAASDNYVGQSTYQLAGPTGSRVSSEAGRAEVWREALTRTVRRLRQAGIPVLIINPIPKFGGWDPKACAVVRVMLAPSTCGTSASLADLRAYRALAVGAEQAAVRDSGPGVSGLDLFGDLCPGDPCRPFRGNSWWWRDGNHVSVGAATSLTRRFLAAMNAA